ncbi:AI-2E family transporter [Methylophilus sp. 3sh_L]|uniref:AI-2E family transporter n=1 Tax=Methylophilus sp. 3sh_L TaxID=3377114 RepID=UPI00398F57EC
MNQTQRLDTATFVLMVGLMWLVLQVQLLPALLVGMLVFELIHVISPLIARKLPGKYAKWLAVMLIATLVIGLLVALGMGIVTLIRSDSGGLAMLFDQLARIIEDSRKVLPPWLNERLPDDAITLQQTVIEWLRSHSADWQLLGKEAGHHLAHILIGMVIGAMVALHDVQTHGNHKPLAQSLLNRITLFALAFKNIVFAQVKISAVNASLTAIYLIVILPLCGVHLPFTKTMIAITFLVGLLPVVGNLMSNTVIVIVSTSHSFVIAMGSLAFLIVIHKLEYFLNARIVGGQIRAHAWELLVAMLLMEATFGLPGIVAAPVYYAYIKSECRARDWI